MTTKAGAHRTVTVAVPASPLSTAPSRGVPCRGRSPDEGGLSIFAVIITMVIAVFFGATVDFSQKLALRHDVNIAAQEAARAGATQVDRDRAYARGGRFVLDQATAIRTAQAYLHAAGYTGTTAAAGATAIRVHVHLSRPAIFLPVDLGADATAVADLTTGITTAQQEAPHG